MNFKKRIETLKASTKSSAAIAVCNEALQRYNTYNNFNLTAEMSDKFEKEITESVKLKLRGLPDPAVNDFIIVENYISNINNLGVKDTLNILKKSELVKDPNTLYLLESVFAYSEKPEWETINFVIENLAPLKRYAVVEQCLNVLTENSEKYATDIKVYKALSECETAGAYEFIAEAEPLIYNYLVYKTDSNKQLVLEHLEKCVYEAPAIQEDANGNMTYFQAVRPTVKNLYNSIESAKTTNVKVNENVSTIQTKVPVKSPKQTEFKSRVERLIESTKSLEAIDICKEVLEAYSDYNHLDTDKQAFEKFELSVSQYLLEKLSKIQESVVDNFVNGEVRINAIKDLGVKRAIYSLKESELMRHPSTMYLIEALTQYTTLPEYMAIEPVLEKIKGLSWNHIVKEHVNILEANAKTYAEDIQIYKTLHEAKNGNSSFILSAVKQDLDNYLTHRSASNRAKLLEKLNNFTYDTNLRNLYNVILESEKSFQMKANSADVSVNKVYSPVIINESSEIFAIRGKAFIKEGNKVRPLTESEFAKLPANFVELSTILAASNVSILENTITIYNRNQKVTINESDNNEVTIKINDNTVSIDEFRQVYLKSGIFNSNDLETITVVNKVVENWNNIFEMDYVKTITPNFATNRKMDVFKLGHEIFVNREDSLVKEHIFYPNCNATQAKHMVMEFTNYDLGDTFTDMLSEESKYVKMFEERRAELTTVINKLQAKKTQLINIQDSDLAESEEVQDLISIINEEIEKVKEEYSKVNRDYKKFIHVQESASTGDTVEYLKKKV